MRVTVKSFVRWPDRVGRTPSVLVVCRGLDPLSGSHATPVLRRGDTLPAPLQRAADGLRHDAEALADRRGRNTLGAGDRGKTLSMNLAGMPAARARCISPAMAYQPGREGLTLTLVRPHPARAIDLHSQRRGQGPNQTTGHAGRYSLVHHVITPVHEPEERVAGREASASVRVRSRPR